jgi:hypothetical protein
MNSATKDKVLCEAFRVLKLGGRFAVSDVVTHGEISPKVRESVLLWVGCIAGALDETEYRNKLAAAGLEPDASYRAEDARDILTANGLDVNTLAADLDGNFFSALVRAVKLSMTIEAVAMERCVDCVKSHFHAFLYQGLRRGAQLWPAVG